ncbi:hypothetical protein KGF56_000242 [Candida oxycetoniae]|uniref:Uncharacterized protein n=1 Tax=Candida oxycetoniae TaxID=497107 RepID=A0AAI9T1L4_9ASCO|nr:uncharacterized protein KGF56_000242 [Candida oxycetoniae]KAI3406949.2 hypothetical protein KGF56_000242 [Candida oxycetoniae]
MSPTTTTSTKPPAENSVVEGSSSQLEPVVQQPENGNSNPNQNQPAPAHGPTKLLTPSHLKNYPLVKTSSTIIGYIPLSGVAINTGRSTLGFIRNYQPFKYIVETGDKYSNSILDQIDKWIPSLQTVEVQDITDPITTPVVHAVDTVQHTISGINETVSRNIIEPVNKNIVEPTKTRIVDAKEGFQAHVYDENGKGIVSSQADPVIGPINEHLEQFVGSHFPDHKKTSSDGYSSEIARTFKIVGNIITREKEDPKGKNEKRK